ncbi:nuclease [Thermococcus profundus]|uniref:Nuclease n=1 Tax=Thermococcus profundus TaxID=49899 RepID=A0A2Z2MBG8_THEPR|nr:PD-(D/E)XK nuclease family protein [Thermococcus profundus]ASJ02829.1 nuclease [Thermococcus profundus]
MEIPDELKTLNREIKDKIAGRKSPRRIWVTSLSFCLRKAALSIYLGTSKYERTGDMLLGTLLHKWVQENVEVGDIEFEVPLEYKISDGWILVGRADAILGDKILEFKLKGFNQENGPGSLKEMEEPSWTWKEQLNAYLTMAGLEEGYIYVFNRDGLDFKHFKVEKDKELFDKLLRRAWVVIRGVEELDQGKFPAWITPRRSDECDSCPFRPICAAIDKPWEKSR